MDTYSAPLMTARDAAAHLQMPESTLDVWLADKRGDEPLVPSVAPERRGWPRVTFAGLIEAHVLRALRELDFKMDEIRSIAAIVRDEFRRPIRAGDSTHGPRWGQPELADKTLSTSTARRGFVKLSNSI